MANGQGYNAGNLNFVVQAISNSSLSSLDKLISKLQTTMKLLGNTSSLSKNLGATIGRKSSSGSFSNSKYVNGQLSSVTNITKMGKAYEKISQVFNEQGKQIKKTIVSVDEYGNKVTKVFSDIEKQAGKTDKKIGAFSLATLFNKIYFIRNYTKQMFRDLIGIVQKAVDYTETLNLWQVAMRGNTQEAEEFVKTMNKAYGIATQTLMEYQAIFKNMLSSLGGISTDVSYALSEYLTQMAIDYASLYNVSIERAMTTFQSVLSGQVRPIRSIAGYDITETTIYQLYQQLGGTKTMRQLSQTEKRLLRIYAVFQQMESSGAIGDLGKTMGSTANQFRMFTESAKELGTWLGIIFEDLIAPFLPKLNAFVITLTNIVKAFAQMKGIKPQEFGVTESVQELNEELDQTQGKLLSFDKFESLNSGTGDGNILGIDENLLNGLTKYESILSGITGEAQELAKKWTALFIDSETGELKDWVDDLILGFEALAIVLGGKLLINAVKFLGKIFGIKNAMQLLNTAILTGAVYAFLKAIEAFKEGDIAGGILATTIGVTLVAALILLELRKKAVARATMYETMAQTAQNKELKDYNLLMKDANNKIASQRGGVALLALGFTSLVGGIVSFVDAWDEMSDVGRWVTIFVSLAAAITATAIALHAFKGNWVKALGVGAMVAGGALMVGSALGKATEFKTGGLVEDGLFQMSRGEIVGEFDDGTTRVANNQQITAGIENASYRGITRGLREINFGGGNVYIDKKKVGQIIAKPSHKEMVRTGLVKVSS